MNDCARTQYALKLNQECVMVHTSLSPRRDLARIPGSTRSLLALALLAGGLALAGCASAPPPNEAMNQAQAQLQAASDAGAADYDPVDLGFARDKFQQAQAAMATRKYAQAADLAAESRADAELARVKAGLGGARAQIQDKMTENARLREQGAAAAEAAAAEFAKPLPLPAGASSAPPPAGPAPMPAAAPQEDMPAPPASMLTAPPGGQGFQSVPGEAPAAASSASDAAGEQP